MSKDYTQLWESLVLNFEKHEGLLTVLSIALMVISLFIFFLKNTKYY